MLKISLRGKHGLGKFAIADDEDASLLQGKKWYVHNKKYAATTVYEGGGRSRILFMHNLILGSKGIDHVNGNGLDNRRSNLRVCTHSQNMMNISRHKDNKSGYKGVSWCKLNKRWKAQITINGKNTYLGLFATPEEAHKIYALKATQNHKEFARVV